MFNRDKPRDNLSKFKPDNFYPEAQYIPHLPKLNSVGKYKKGFPEGIVIHYTGGDINQSGQSAVEQALFHGYLYFFIDKGGYVYQQFDLSEWGYHAGVSQCPVTKRTSVSKLYVGIEVACGGLITNNKTWFGKRVSPINIREADPSYLVSGQFEKFTEIQERSLTELCVWLCSKGVNPDLIFGHNEVAPMRKIDPGASLSMCMMNFREHVKKEFQNWKSLQPS